ncbi:uncharacterized protein LOC113847617 [Abrus precatorius]|uniref:Uncharacterized protein LOC113847617 n=1 Tax=Abrus precatorius TaxID=3816 RepID=A0A8B8JMG5_ABRPR|nr:uncharacterized protein LOC113847617 [Abrus precatorius]
MGKKKPQKIKELSVAIGEASSTIDEMGQQQQQPPPQAPRKRGRPRKIIVKMESEEEKAQAIAAQGTESSTEKGSTKEEEGASETCMRITKQEVMQLPKGEPSRSRARRKSKPRKSS